MFDFHFVYTDGRTYDIANVNKIVIQTASSLKELTGDAILSTDIPLKTMHLYSTNGNCTISGNNLLIIDVIKQ